MDCLGLMRFVALATDYDGTLASHGVVYSKTVEALRRLRRSGRRVILVTGRTLRSLRDVFPCLTEFDSIVAENGATLYNPTNNTERLLATAPSEALLSLLERRSSVPLEVGRCIIATPECEKQTVLNAIQELGLELQIIFNKGSLMILPSGVNKATGLMVALKTLGLSLHNVAGIGDAENDHAFLEACEFSAAVADALPTLKERVDLVTRAPHGFGVAELIDRILEDDLASHERRLGKQTLIGRDNDGQDVCVPACGFNLIAGSSGGGKSTLTTSFLESLFGLGYQFCVLDAEGDYELLSDATVVGNSNHVPTPGEIVKALGQPTQNAVVNLLGVELAERPAMLETILNRLQECRSKIGRPHCVVVDEAHHFLDSGQSAVETYLEAQTDDAANGLTLITVNPDRLPASVLAKVHFLAITGEEPISTLRTFCSSAGLECPAVDSLALGPDQIVGWFVGDGVPFAFATVSTDTVRVRHRRKYAEGELAPERSFYFRGPEGKLNLRAHNLISFMTIMSGVDDDTWRFHLRNGDYSSWFRKEIKDEELSSQVKEIENARNLPLEEGRRKLQALITERYTFPA